MASISLRRKFCTAVSKHQRKEMNQISFEALNENDLSVNFKDVIMKHPFRQL